jgi:hypothetical protein
MRLILTACEESPFARLIRFAAGRGLRASELLGLEWAGGN